jgi:hypothetical protein
MLHVTPTAVRGVLQGGCGGQLWRVRWTEQVQVRARMHGCGRLLRWCWCSVGAFVIICTLTPPQMRSAFPRAARQSWQALTRCWWQHSHRPGWLLLWGFLSLRWLTSRSPETPRGVGSYKRMPAVVRLPGSPFPSSRPLYRQVYPARACLGGCFCPTCLACATLSSTGNQVRGNAVPPGSPSAPSRWSSLNRRLANHCCCVGPQ